MLGWRTDAANARCTTGMDSCLRLEEKTTTKCAASTIIQFSKNGSAIYCPTDLFANLTKLSRRQRNTLFMNFLLTYIEGTYGDEIISEQASDGKQSDDTCKFVKASKIRRDESSKDDAAWSLLCNLLPGTVLKSPGFGWQSFQAFFLVDVPENAQEAAQNYKRGISDNERRALAESIQKQMLSKYLFNLDEVIVRKIKGDVAIFEVGKLTFIDR
ncbi:unnamed protein product [Acanthocheilonema viteae]|uniref:Uncharacterized protein n=1 Tax=Acanthocheilonema viteae TaxID=6277 RepID=A0A498S244_ACAVI|nr:unnamed protein product [Acanthocheilonema viteae]